MRQSCAWEFRFTLKPQRAEAVPVGRDTLVGDPFAHQARGDRREQGPSTKMSRGHDEAAQVGRAKNGKMVLRIGTQAGPGFFDARVFEAGRQASARL